MTLTYIQPGILLIVAVLLYGVWKRSRRVIAAAAALLFLWSWEPAAALLVGTLERRYPVRPLPEGTVDVIVVLSGGVYRRDATEPEDLPRADTFLRTSYAAWLYHNWRAVPVLATGGVESGDGKAAVAEVMRRVLEEKGVPPSMVWVEGRSRSTYENALYSAEFLRAKGIRRIALVTEAYHMPRSERAFRRQGLIVTPSPVFYRSLRFSGEAVEFVPEAHAIETNELALHEWAGLLWYRITGKA